MNAQLYTFGQVRSHYFCLLTFRKTDGMFRGLRAKKHHLNHGNVGRQHLHNTTVRIVPFSGKRWPRISSEQELSATHSQAEGMGFGASNRICFPVGHVHSPPASPSVLSLPLSNRSARDTILLDLMECSLHVDQFLAAKSWSRW
jgi:hypothetical protein